MLKNKFIISVLCACAFLTTAAVAEDVKAGSVKVPSGNKVVLVGRISFKTPINYDARKAALEEESSGSIIIGTDKTKHYYSIGETSLTNLSQWELEEPFYFTAKPGKDGTVTLDFARCYLFGYVYNFFDLPLEVKVAIPEGAKFVYVGDFQYDLDYALRIVGTKHLDEFDAAKKQIKRATGKDVEIVRGEISEIKEDEDASSSK